MSVKVLNIWMADNGLKQENLIILAHYSIDKLDKYLTSVHNHKWTNELRRSELEVLGNLALYSTDGDISDTIATLAKREN